MIIHLNQTHNYSTLVSDYFSQKANKTEML